MRYPFLLGILAGVVGVLILGGTIKLGSKTFTLGSLTGSN